MDLLQMSKQEFNVKMDELNINSGDIVYIEAKISPESFNPIVVNKMIHNLLDYLGSEGTIVMNVSGYNYDLNEKVFLNEDIKKYTLPYQNSTRTIFSSSLLANYLSLFKEAKFSSSDIYPFVALGKYATLITNGQTRDFPNGNRSPFSKLYELRAKALLVNHDIKSFVLNRHAFEVSENAVVKVNGGIMGDEYASYLERKIDDNKMTSIFNSSKYKELFYFSKVKEIPILGIDVREYIDYCRKYIEE